MKRFFKTIFGSFLYTYAFLLFINVVLGFTGVYDIIITYLRTL